LVGRLRRVDVCDVEREIAVNGRIECDAISGHLVGAWIDPWAAVARRTRDCDAERLAFVDLDRWRLRSG
jgi:hypothetical protein